MTTPPDAGDAARRAAYLKRNAEARAQEPDATAPTTAQHRKLVRLLRKLARTTPAPMSFGAAVLPAREHCGPAVMLAPDVLEKELIAQVLLHKATTKTNGRPHNLANDCLVIEAARQLNSRVTDRPTLNRRLREIAPATDSEGRPVMLSEATARDRIRALTLPLNEADPTRKARPSKNTK